MTLNSCWKPGILPGKRNFIFGSSAFPIPVPYSRGTIMMIHDTFMGMKVSQILKIVPLLLISNIESAFTLQSMRILRGFIWIFRGLSPPPLHFGGEIAWNQCIFVLPAYYMYIPSSSSFPGARSWPWPWPSSEPFLWHLSLFSFPFHCIKLISTGSQSRCWSINPAEKEMCTLKKLKLCCKPQIHS